MVDEAERLSALHKYRILDTDPERQFDDLTLLAAQICGTPIALISLLDEHRQWFKSRIGMAVAETARSVSFCTHAIQQSGVFVVPDALTDDRFRTSPLVQGEPHIRFYAGAPLTTREGVPLGTICVIDRRPRILTVEQLEALEALRRQAEAQLDLRRNLEELRVAIAGLESLAGLIPYCSTCQLNIVIPADPAAMWKITAGVNELLAGRRWPEEEIIKVELAVVEALANAIRHGCKNDPTKQVQCCVTFDAAGELVIVVRDPGPGFDVTAVPNPLATDNLLKPSGRGVYLLNQLMDTVEYSDRGREVQLRKRGPGVS